MEPRKSDQYYLARLAVSSNVLEPKMRLSDPQSGNGRLIPLLGAIAAILTALTGFLALGPKLGWWGKQAVNQPQAELAPEDTATSQYTVNNAGHEKNAKTAQEPVTEPVTGGATLLTKPYELTKTISEQKAFTDPETGLVFAVDKIYNTTFLFSPIKGADVNYRIPSGQYETASIDVGSTIDFKYKGRSFIVVAEDIDYGKHTVTIRIKEV